jgi:hypothetical protein
MEIAGEWLVCDDGVARPVVRAQVLGAAGTYHSEPFLVDSGADRTALSAAMLATLGFVAAGGTPGYLLTGVGGSSAFVVVTTALELTREDGARIRINGPFVAFTDPTATDRSILGRDVLNHFDVILSRPRGEVLLLAGNHHYVVTK